VYKLLQLLLLLLLLRWMLAVVDPCLRGLTCEDSDHRF
jgi:hypothetical protein